MGLTNAHCASLKKYRVILGDIFKCSDTWKGQIVDNNEVRSNILACIRGMITEEDLKLRVGSKIVEANLKRAEEIYQIQGAGAVREMEVLS